MALGGQWPSRSIHEDSFPHGMRHLRVNDVAVRAREDVLRVLDVPLAIDVVDSAAVEIVAASRRKHVDPDRIGLRTLYPERPHRAVLGKLAETERICDL